MLGLLVWNIGIGEVVAHLRQIGWLVPLLLVPYIAIALCDAKGWACAIPFSAHARKVPLWRLSLARIAGEAVNNLTPTANLGGEPIKVYLLRAHGLIVDSGLASVVVAKTTLVVSQIVFILLGLQRRGLIGMAVGTLRRLLPHWQRLAQWEARAQRIDAHLLGFYEGNTRGFIASTVYHFIGWLLGAVEVLFFFHLMGVPVAPVDALIIETMVQPLTAAALVIPGALGVQEAGGVFLCRLLGLDDGAGLTLMVLKRAREAVYNLIGLTVLARVSGVLFPQKAHSL